MVVTVPASEKFGNGKKSQNRYRSKLVLDSVLDVDFSVTQQQQQEQQQEELRILGVGWLQLYISSHLKRRLRFALRFKPLFAICLFKAETR